MNEGLTLLIAISETTRGEQVIGAKNQSNIVGQLTKQCVLFQEILRIFAMVLKWYFPYFIF
jgi:hypothetical protein